MIDNDIYHRRPDLWWNEDGFLHVLRTGLNTARFVYFRDVLTQHHGLAPAGLRVVDIGCGGGYLAEEFARLGCDVTGIDPAEPTLEAARTHAQASGLTIAYRRGTGEQLPLDTASYDVATCCDVLEHVSDVDAVLTEIARVLKPGGVFFFDTINRTQIARFVMITLMQDWSFTAMMPRNVHDWKMFVKPTELTAKMAGAGLRSRDLAGLRPHANPFSLMWTFVQRKRGTISYAEVGRKLDFRACDDLSVSYMGWAIKQCPP